MANINIYGTLFSNLSELNDKVIVLGSQVYGNDTSAPAKDESGVYPETGKLISKAEFNGLLGTGWTSGLVPGSQYDINRFFKAKINNISANYVPYSGATKNVSLGSNYHITSKGFYLSTANKYTNFGNLIGSSGDDTNIQILINNREAYGVNTSYNCIGLADIFNKVPLNFPGSQGSSLFACLISLKSKIDHITNPLRFKGVINSGGKLPDSGVEVGDVWHFNADVTPYYGGDEVVCTSISPNITWELLGQNITPIPTGSITFENLESN